MNVLENDEKDSNSSSEGMEKIERDRSAQESLQVEQEMSDSQEQLEADVLDEEENDSEETSGIEVDLPEREDTMTEVEPGPEAEHSRISSGETDLPAEEAEFFSTVEQEAIREASQEEIPQTEAIEGEAELSEEAVAAEEAEAAKVAQPEAQHEELEAEAEDVPLPEPDDGRLWYVVHCYSGYENKVRHNLEQRIESMGMKGKIFDVVVPTEEEMEVRDGKRRTVERRVFPGYILVQMLMDEDSWYVVRNTPGVTGFVGMGNDPTPLRPEEVQQIIKRMEAEAPRIKVTYSIGQKVRIIDGPFNDFIGTVDDIDMNRAKVRVMVSFFGRETPVELDFLQVEKA